MKLFVKLILALLVLALLLPFTLLKDDSGKPLASFADFGLPEISLPKMPDFSTNKSPQPARDDDLSGKVLFYRWYDAQGNVQFTSEPPADGIEYTIKGFDPNANVIQAIEIPTIENEVEDKPSSQNKSPGETGNPYSQESIKKLFEDTKNIEKLLNQRLQQQESIAN